MQIIKSSLIVLSFGITAAAVNACGHWRSDVGNIEMAFSADPPTAEELELARLCGRPELPASKSLNIEYKKVKGVDPNLLSLDVYTPKVLNPCRGAPVVIFVHGGGWRMGDKSQMRYKPDYFNALGYVFVSINYRLSPQNDNMDPARIMFPIHPEDVGSAVAWVHRNIKAYGGDSEKIALLGHSAGAHLAALVGTDQRYIQRAFAQWNPTHLRCVGSYDTEGFDIPRLMAEPDPRQRALYINAFGDEPVIWYQASPINHVKKNGPAFQLVRRGNKERHAQTEAFKSALEAKGNSVSLIQAQGLSHNEVNQLIGDPDDSRMTPAVSEFMKTHCFPKR